MRAPGSSRGLVLRGLASRHLASAGLVVGGLALGACSASSAPLSGPSGGQVNGASVGNLGTVLVDGAGHTLYLFEPDHHGSVSTCSGSCAAAWPPLILPVGRSSAQAGAGVQGSLLGTTRRSDGSLQVTYDGWPLYLWVGDTRAGVATGQALDQFGGYWYVVDPAGNAVTG